MAKPPMISLASVNGPSIVLTCPRVRRTRELVAVGASPPLWTIVPALTASSASLPMASMSAWGGGPEFSADLTSIMKRIVCLLVAHAAVLIIHDTPNLSVTTPNAGDQNVLPSGICTAPPSERPLNSFSAAATVGGLNASEMPSNFGWPLQWQSDAITVVSPTRNIECITFFSVPGGMPWHGSGLSPNRISATTSAPSDLP